jgi:adenylate kinase
LGIRSAGSDAEQTAPLVAFYADQGILIGFDATGLVNDITDRAIEALRHIDT